MAKTPLPAHKSKPANPLLAARWDASTGLPPFQRIEPAHFRPAFDAAFAAHREEIAAIAADPRAPSFANTIVAYERSGRMHARVGEVFFNLAGAHTNDDLRAIEREITPKYAEHFSAILLNRELFKRVDTLHARRDTLKLTDEQRRALELHHLAFVRAGARLGPKAKKRITAINMELARLTTQFSQNVLADEQSWRLVLEGEKDLAGLSPAMRESAERAAADQGLDGKHVITLSRSSVEPFLRFSDRRDLREEAFRAWMGRGERGGETDNRGILAGIVRLRQELARLLGHETYAGYSLEDTMAKTPSAVRELLLEVWPRAVKRAGEERAALEAAARGLGHNHPIAPWDWRYFAEKVRQSRFDLDEAEVRPYFALENMIAAAFDTASRLFGVRFEEVERAPRYHPGVRVWTVLDGEGRKIGLFLGDYFARPSKQSGAWMSGFRWQHKLGRGETPIIINVMNFARGADGEPTLLSFDDARTLFHEFGHGLHGLLSNVTYPSLSGTAVVRDFVELPSQLFEHWLDVPEVLKRFARHYKTDKPIPDTLLRRIEAARKWNQGFDTVTYTASALVDMELHALDDTTGFDADAFERDVLDKLGMPEGITMRHRLPHFQHITGGYAAGYYSYLWSEVMDADAFAAFKEAGDPFAPEVAALLKEFIYSAGNTRDPEAAYLAFRGHPPKIDGLLAKRGLD